MTEPLLSDVLTGATEDATTVAFPKSALRKLTAAANNKADGIFAGIVDSCIDYYTPIRRDGDSTATPPVVGDKDVSIVVQLEGRLIVRDFETGTEYEEKTVTFKFYKELPSSNFDPDDY